MSTSEVDQLTASLKDVELQIERLYDAITGGLDVNLIKAPLAPLQEQKAALQGHISRLKDDSSRGGYLSRVLEDVATTQGMIKTLK